MAMAGIYSSGDMKVSGLQEHCTHAPCDGGVLKLALGGLGRTEGPEASFLRFGVLTETEAMVPRCAQDRNEVGRQRFSGV